MLAPAIPLKIEKVKRTVLAREGLVWTDLLVLCALLELKEGIGLVEPIALIKHLEMDRCWVYRSLKKLREKDLINIRERPQAPALVSLSGWGRVLLQRAGDCFEGHNAYLTK